MASNHIHRSLNRHCSSGSKPAKKLYPVAVVFTLIIFSFMSMSCATTAIRATSLQSGRTVLISPLAYRSDASSFYSGGKSDDYPGMSSTDYIGISPIDKSALLYATAHVLFIDKPKNGLSVIVVYFGEKDGAGTGVSTVLSSKAINGDSSFIDEDFTVKDGYPDTYLVEDGNIMTRHNILDIHVADGYAVNLNTKFDEEGEKLLLTLRSPHEYWTPRYVTNLVVYAGQDEQGAPIWFELEKGDFSEGVSVEFTVVPAEK